MATLRSFGDLTAFLVLITSAHCALAESVGPISEETPPAVCDLDRFSEAFGAPKVSAIKSK